MLFRSMEEDPAVEAARQQFKEQLYKEVSTDNDDVVKKWDDLMYNAKLGSIWEFEIWTKTVALPI